MECPDSIKQAIRNWVTLLSRHEFGKAAAILGSRRSKQAWDAEALLRSIGLYNRAYADALENGKSTSGLAPTVTNPSKIQRSGESFRACGDENEVRVAYELPLDGTWSDLTAEFLFYKHQGAWEMELEDLRVM